MNWNIGPPRETTQESKKFSINFVGTPSGICVVEMGGKLGRDSGERAGTKSQRKKKGKRKKTEKRAGPSGNDARA